MAAIAGFMERNHRPIIIVLVLVIVVMAASCIFHDLIQVCHLVFGCDHRMHVAAAF